MPSIPCHEITKAGRLSGLLISNSGSNKMAGFGH
jgi:hypothetical protein